MNIVFKNGQKLMNQNLMKKTLVFLLILCSLPAAAGAAKTEHTANPERNTKDEIQWIIEQVETSDCAFFRNGKKHSAEDAADHLRLKLRRGGKYATTTEEFVEKLASRSSWTGRPYHIQCGSDDRQTMGEWLDEKLESLRATSETGKN